MNIISDLETRAELEELKIVIKVFAVTERIKTITEGL